MFSRHINGYTKPILIKINGLRAFFDTENLTPSNERLLLKKTSATGLIQMLSYEITDDSLYFSWPDDETILGFRSSTLAVPSCFDRAALIQMAEGIKSLCLSNAVTSYRGHFRSARNIFSQVKSDSRPFPPEPENWDNFVLSHYGNFLTDSRRKYKTRIDHWSGIAFLYKKLQRSGFIPSDVYIPNETLSSLKGELSSRDDRAVTGFYPVHPRSGETETATGLLSSSSQQHVDAGADIGLAFGGRCRLDAEQAADLMEATQHADELLGQDLRSCGSDCLCETITDL